MERSQILDMMGTLKLFGMRSAYDEIMPPASSASTNRRASSVTCFSRRSPRSRRAPSNTRSPSPSCRWPRTSTTSTSPTRRSTKAWCASLRQEPSSPSSTISFWSAERHGKSHLSIALARALIRNGARVRFFNVVDLVNRLETEARSGKQGRLADFITRLDFVHHGRTRLSPIRPGRWSAPLPPDQQAIRAGFDHCHDEPGLRRVAGRIRRRQDDRRPARQAHPPLR
ncbi:IstB-like ATP binding protein, partial [Xaviernesmea oryzae]